MGRSCHTEGTCNGSLCERMGGKPYRKAGESTHTLQSLSWEKWPLLTMIPHMVTEQPLCGKSLGAVGTLKPLLCSIRAREEGEGVVRKEIREKSTQ